MYKHYAFKSYVGIASYWVVVWLQYSMSKCSVSAVNATERDINFMQGVRIQSKKILKWQGSVSSFLSSFKIASLQEMGKILFVSVCFFCMKNSRTVHKNAAVKHLSEKRKIGSRINNWIFSLSSLLTPIWAC